LQAKLNTELLNNLGNYVNRVLSFIAKPEGWFSYLVIFLLEYLGLVAINMARNYIYEGYDFCLVVKKNLDLEVLGRFEPR
jgi:hypothetical protein